MEELLKAYNKTDLPAHCECLETILNYFEGDTAEELIDYISEEYINHADIVYYSNAINYLKENDPSLMESLSIVWDCGFEVDKLNSEILASLLLQSNLRDDLENLRDDFEEYFLTKGE